MTRNNLHDNLSTAFYNFKLVALWGHMVAWRWLSQTSNRRLIKAISLCYKVLRRK